MEEICEGNLTNRETMNQNNDSPICKMILFPRRCNSSPVDQQFKSCVTHQENDESTTSNITNNTSDRSSVDRSSVNTSNNNIRNPSNNINYNTRNITPNNTFNKAINHSKQFPNYDNINNNVLFYDPQKSLRSSQTSMNEHHSDYQNSKSTYEINPRINARNTTPISLQKPKISISKFKHNNPLESFNPIISNNRKKTRSVGDDENFEFNDTHNEDRVNNNTLDHADNYKKINNSNQFKSEFRTFNRSIDNQYDSPNFDVNNNNNSGHFSLTFNHQNMSSDLPCTHRNLANDSFNSQNFALDSPYNNHNDVTPNINLCGSTSGTYRDGSNIKNRNQSNHHRDFFINKYDQSEFYQSSLIPNNNSFVPPALKKLDSDNNMKNDVKMRNYCHNNFHDNPNLQAHALPHLHAHPMSSIDTCQDNYNLQYQKNRYQNDHIRTYQTNNNTSHIFKGKYRPHHQVINNEGEDFNCAQIPSQAKLESDRKHKTIDYYQEDNSTNLDNPNINDHFSRHIIEGSNEFNDKEKKFLKMVINHGVKLSEACDFADIQRGVGYKILRKYRRVKLGNIKHNKSNSIKILNGERLEILDGILDRYPDASTKELLDAFFEKTNIKISKSTLERGMNQLGIVLKRKKYSNEVILSTPTSSESEYLIWLLKLSIKDYRLLIFIDECGFRGYFNSRCSIINENQSQVHICKDKLPIQKSLMKKNRRDKNKLKGQNNESCQCKLENESPSDIDSEDDITNRITNNHNKMKVENGHRGCHSKSKNRSNVTNNIDIDGDVENSRGNINNGTNSILSDINKNNKVKESDLYLDNDDEHATSHAVKGHKVEILAAINGDSLLQYSIVGDSRGQIELPDFIVELDRKLVNRGITNAIMIIGNSAMYKSPNLEERVGKIINQVGYLCSNGINLNPLNEMWVKIKLNTRNELQNLNDNFYFINLVELAIKQINRDDLAKWYQNMRCYMNDSLIRNQIVV